MILALLIVPLLWVILGLWLIAFLLVASNYLLWKEWSRFVRLLATVPVWLLSALTSIWPGVSGRAESTVGQWISLIGPPVASLAFAMVAWWLLFRSIAGSGWFHFPGAKKGDEYFE